MSHHSGSTSSSTTQKSSSPFQQSFHDYASMRSKPPSKKQRNNDDSEREDGEIDDDDMDNEQVELYCICRTSDTNRFMIGCDNCNEWYHGDCISITEEYAKRIAKWYCLICQSKDNSLTVKYKDKKIPIKKKEVTIKEPVILVCEKKKEKEVEREESKEDPDYREHESSRYQMDSSGGDDDEDEDYYEPTGKKVKKYQKEKKSSVVSSKKKKQRPGKPTNARARNEKKNKQNKRKYGNSRREKKEENIKKTHKKKEHVVVEEDKPKQCYGPECVQVARKGSKYCSDECGLKLANNRIVEILPNRIMQWQSTPCVADERSAMQLEEIKKERDEVRRVLSDLDAKQQKLDELMKEGKSIAPEDDSVDAENEAESELNIYCVTCGHEVNHRFAMKHMERCFNKHEGQTSFGSIFKTKIEGQTVFCDVFNPHQRTYCKRLRIMCPEHCKDPKIADDEVCGAPLVVNVFEDTDKFCRILKKKCNKHYLWEKLRRAELDTLRIQQWLKLDDLLEREQKIRQQMANRCGILGLMLHQTIIHDENEYNKNTQQQQLESP